MRRQSPLLVVESDAFMALHRVSVRMLAQLFFESNALHLKALRCNINTCIYLGTAALPTPPQLCLVQTAGHAVDIIMGC